MWKTRRGGNNISQEYEIMRMRIKCIKYSCHNVYNNDVIKTDARFMQDGQKAVWSIPYVSMAFFPSLK